MVSTAFKRKKDVFDLIFAAMDLSVKWVENREIFFKTLENIIKLGYDTICINYHIEELKIKTSRKGKEQPMVIKSPSEILMNEKMLQVMLDKYRVSKRPFRQVSRFSTVISNTDQINRLQRDEVIRTFDVISVRPTTEKLFMSACQTLDVDIISLDLTQRLPFSFKRANVGVAIERGIHFEIEYCPMIRDVTARRNTISNSISLMRVCKGKNIILSSASDRPIEIRGPYDVANLGLLFEMKEHHAKAAVFSNCEKVLIHAKGRKTTSCTVSMCKITVPEEDSNKDVVDSKESDDDSDEPMAKKLKTESESNVYDAALGSNE